MAKKSKNEQTQQPDEGKAKAKTPEQIAAEIANNGVKPLIAAIVVFIGVGVTLMVMSRQDAAKNQEVAEGYEKLDAVILKPAANPFSIQAPDSPETLDKTIKELSSLRESGINSNAVKDALFFEAKALFDKGAYGDAAQKFKEYYTTYPGRLPLADFAKLNAVNAYINSGTTTDIEQAMAIVESTTASNNDVQDKLRYQLALCNILLGGKDRVDTAKTILEELSNLQSADGKPRMISGDASNLLSLVEQSDAEDLKVLPNDFPASMVKETSAEESSEKVINKKLPQKKPVPVRPKK